MKTITAILLAALVSCTSPTTNSKSTSIEQAQSTTTPKSDTSVANAQPQVITVRDTVVIHDTVVVDRTKPTGLRNTRFRNVTVEKVGHERYLVRGEAQVFEAVFSWVIEDGHKELKKGNEVTDAGAPAWGQFAFIVNAKKERPNSTLHLVIYEVSANDGSRQHQMSIPLK